MNTDLLTLLDETNSKLIEAITTARNELSVGRCIEAGITLTMALQEHKATLMSLTQPEPISKLWEHENDTD